MCIDYKYSGVEEINKLATFTGKVVFIFKNINFSIKIFYLLMNKIPIMDFIKCVHKYTGDQMIMIHVATYSISSILLSWKNKTVHCNGYKRS